MAGIFQTLQTSAVFEAEVAPRRGTAEVSRRIFHLFADLLEYPRPGLAQVAQECETLVSHWSAIAQTGAGQNGRATALLREFRTFVEDTPLGRQQEVYTVTFDLDAACYPYVGYHLFGESYKRSVFMIKLKEHYVACNLAMGNELPDHLALVVRYLSLCDDASLADELIQLALLPTLEKMTGKRTGSAPEAEESQQHQFRALPARPTGRSVYHQLLQALWLWLQELPLAIRSR